MGGRALGQIDDLSVGGEHVDLLAEDVGLERGGQILGIGDLLLPLHQLAQPVDLLVEAAVGPVALLVAPVGRDAVLRLLVHLVGPDLDLEVAAPGADHRGVQRAVEVGLGLGDVVVELARDGLPQAVHQPQHRVALPQLLHQHAHGRDVVDLFEAQALALHLLVDAVDVLGPAHDLGGDVGLGQLLLEDPHDLLDRGAPGRALLGEQFADLAVGVGLELTKGEILEFPLDLPDAQAVGQRGEDLHGLLGHLVALGPGQVAHGAHTVDAVGQGDEHHPHVGGHGQEHLAQVLGRFPLEAVPLDPVEPAHALEQADHLGAEALLERPRIVGDGDPGLQDPRGEGGGVQAQIQQQRGDVERPLERGRGAERGRLAQGVQRRALLGLGVDLAQALLELFGGDLGAVGHRRAGCRMRRAGATGRIRALGARRRGTSRERGSRPKLASAARPGDPHRRVRPPSLKESGRSAPERSRARRSAGAGPGCRLRDGDR